MPRPSLSLLGTLLGAVVTTVTVALIDTPKTEAYTLEQIYHRAAPTQEQQETQSDVVDKARDLVDRFTRQNTGLNTEPTQPTESANQMNTQETPFDPGPTESFAEAQGLHAPADDLPSSGFGLPIAALALGITSLKHRKHMAKYLRS